MLRCLLRSDMTIYCIKMQSLLICTILLQALNNDARFLLGHFLFLLQLTPQTHQLFHPPPSQTFSDFHKQTGLMHKGPAKPAPSLSLSCSGVSAGPSLPSVWRCTETPLSPLWPSSWRWGWWSCSAAASGPHPTPAAKERRTDIGKHTFRFFYLFFYTFFIHYLKDFYSITPFSNYSDGSRFVVEKITQS